MHTDSQAAEGETSGSAARNIFPLLLITVFVLALGLRLGFIASSDFDNVVRGDAVEYVSYAYNLANKGVFSAARPDSAVALPDSYRAPGYPAFLAVAVAISGDTLAWMEWIRSAQALLGALTAVLATILARRMLPPTAAIACGLLVAFWPHLIAIDTYFIAEGLTGFFLLLALVANDTAMRIPNGWRLSAAGVLWGLTYLINPVFLFAPLLYLPWLLRGRNARLCLVFVLASFALPMAWGIRNASLPVTGLSSGDRALSNFVQGSWPEYHAAYNSRNAGDQPARLLSRIGAEDALIHADKSAGLNVMAVRMSRDPLLYAFWYLGYKPYLLWAWSIRLGSGDIYVYPIEHSSFEQPGVLATVRSAARAINPWLFFLAAGYTARMLLIALRRGMREEAYPRLQIVLLFFYLTAVHTVLQAEPRYAIPYRPLEFILAMLAIHGLFRWLRTLRTPSPEPPKVGAAQGQHCIDHFPHGSRNPLR